MYNTHVAAHYASSIERLEVAVHNVRGNLALYLYAQEKLSEMRRTLAALAAENAVPKPVDADEQAGFNAFPAGRWMDAVRGTKSFPTEARCPFRRPERIAAWTRGYEAARAALATP